MFEFLRNNTIILWGIAVIAVLVVLRYLYIFIKRLSLVSRLRLKFGKSLTFTRNPFVSLFVVNGKPDFIIDVDGKETAVAILSTSRKRTRYHFNENGLLEIIVARRGMTRNVRRNSSNNNAYLSGGGGDVRVYVKRKYSLNLVWQDCIAEQKYIVVNPAPKELSKANGSQTEFLVDNDLLFNGIKICGAKYFMENFKG